MKFLKKLNNIFFFILLFLTLNCYDQYQNNNNLKNIKIKQDYNYDFENDIEIYNLKMALSYTRNIKYKNDKKDYWQTPEETYNLKTGDCEDFSIYLLYIVWTKLQIDDCYFVATITNEGIHHAIVQINGDYYESQSGFKIWYLQEENILWKAHYTEIIWMTENYHNNIGKYY